MSHLTIYLLSVLPSTWLIKRLSLPQVVVGKSAVIQLAFLACRRKKVSVRAEAGVEKRLMAETKGWRSLEVEEFRRERRAGLTAAASSPIPLLLTEKGA
jgi:hypothetical protein